jgi:hypothetical protein
MSKKNKKNRNNNRNNTVLVANETIVVADQPTKLNDFQRFVLANVDTDYEIRFQAWQRQQEEIAGLNALRNVAITVTKEAEVKAIKDQKIAAEAAEQQKVARKIQEAKDRKLAKRRENLLVLKNFAVVFTVYCLPMILAIESLNRWALAIAR